MEGFNIAFLDIMASGLGAIILVLIIVKQDVDKSSPEVALLQADLAKVQAQDKQLKKSLSESSDSALDVLSKMTKIQAATAAVKAEILRKNKELAQQNLAVSSIKDTIEKSPIARQDDVLKTDAGGEENYIMGLKVEGRKILLLLDSSASMTDEKLINIIRRKNSSQKEKKRGPKWQRSKRIVRWLLARSPKSSKIAVVAYNHKSKLLGAASWVNSRDASSIKKITRDLDRLVPTGATNLQRGLQKVRALQPTDVYVITDGLPTAGESGFSRLNPFSSCGGLLGRANTISGACRIKLFQQTLRESAPGRGIKVNIILLPLEGDPQASSQYWAWSSATGGLLISPAEQWP
ncbi:MAG: VWA domain-containing protein [Mariprofundaceae bacterium]|nr:VWA domain-containing protein [Mariprofundaceae bacterium]